MQDSGSPVREWRLAATARLALLAMCVAQVAIAAGCAKATAADLVPDGPPLVMSAPPPRVITPAEDGEVAPPSPPNPATPAAATAGNPTAKPATPRTAPRANNTAPAQEAPAAAAPATPPPPAAPPLEVRSVSSAAAAAEEKKVRDVMARASGILDKITYQRLSQEGKTQYDQSKRFIEQADQALKEKNFVYALQLAENAATFAERLR